MAYYNYYQQQQPQFWGTQQYQLPPAPVLPYVPQSNWTGADYYRAHSDWSHVDDDNSLWDSISRGVRRIVGNRGMNGEEAERCHQRVYGGLIDMRSAPPEVIGAAAAYEAMRFWERNSALRGPVLDDHEREEEAIFGLALAETNKLWGYTNRLMHDHGRKEACEEAAGTVHRIYRHNRRRHSRYNAFDGGRRYRQESYDNPYASDHHRSRRQIGGVYDYDDDDDSYYSDREYDDGYNQRIPRRARARSFSGYSQPGLLSPGQAYAAVAPGGYVGTPGLVGSVGYPGSAYGGGGGGALMPNQGGYMQAGVGGYQQGGSSFLQPGVYQPRYM